MKKNLLMVLSLILIISVFPTYSSASTKVPIGNVGAPVKSPIVNNEEIIEIDITEENFETALEIAQSDLENSIYVGNDGKFKTTFTDHQSANVSKETFDIFLKTLDILNQALEEGLIYIENPDLGLNGIGLPNFDIQDSINDKNNVVTPMFKVIGTYYYKLSNSDVKKINKIIKTGGSAIALASALGISTGVAVIVFAAAQFLGALLDLCNWYDKGIYIRKIGKSWACWPAR